MPNIKVVDARMGRGKTSAAVDYMITHPDKRFIYVTPYLTEVSRICHACDFEQPDDETGTKLNAMRELVMDGKNISTTHSLLFYADNELLSEIKSKGYCLIIDESIDVVRRVPITNCDFKAMSDYIIIDDEDGRIRWGNYLYDGVLNKYKELAVFGAMYRCKDELFAMARPEMFTSFEEVIFMTYCFDGQYQKAYLDLYGFQYTKCGVDTSAGFKLTDKPDDPPPIDYHNLINIIDDEKLNQIGNAPRDLCLSWYKRRGRYHKDMCKLRGNMQKIMRRMGETVPTSHLLWTTFKNSYGKLVGENGRYSTGYLQMNARATNAYRDRDVVMYLVNRFVDPAIREFFMNKGVMIDEDQYALSEMLQFIWRSAIRDSKPITLYIPSKRMRNLLKKWIDDVSKGGCLDA